MSEPVIPKPISSPPGERASAKAAQQIQRYQISVAGTLVPFFDETRISYVLTADHAAALSSQEARIKELEAALRECVYAVISGSSVVTPSARQALSPEGERK